MANKGKIIQPSIYFLKDGCEKIILIIKKN